MFRVRLATSVARPHYAYVRLQAVWRYILGVQRGRMLATALILVIYLCLYLNGGRISSVCVEITLR